MSANERYDFVAGELAAGGYSTQVRPSGDALGTHPASRPAQGGEGRGASLRPFNRRTQEGTHLPSAVKQDVVEPTLCVEEAAAFAAVEEASAEPLLGDRENTVLAAGGSAVWWGDGGAGKTTSALDRAFHYCAGQDWLGLEVPRPVSVLWIENEGPRGKFREKVGRKLDAWDGPALEGRLHVLAAPWARFSFTDEQMRAELAELVRVHGIEIVIAGPIARLGLVGGGTPEEIQVFVNLLEQVRGDLGGPLAYELLHHENKAGGISGAWEGATDTLVHVQGRGHGRTAFYWNKTRWAGELQGKTWKLNWLEGESFELDETPETTDDEIRAKLLELVTVERGRSWNAYDELLSGKAKKKRQVRDQLLEEGQLVNAGTPKAMRLFLPEQVPDLGQTTLEEA